MELSKLSPPAGSRKKRTRFGRGEASGHGKTAGRGGKGQKGRAGARIRAGFEGGQIPLLRRIPKLGFVSPGQIKGRGKYSLVNLDLLNKFNDGEKVSFEHFVQLGVVTSRSSNKLQGGIKLLARGTLTKKLTIEVQAFSKSAKEAVEKAGGQIVVVPVV